MQFGVLGSFRVLDGSGREIPIRSVRQRSLLAVLLCDDGRMVPVDRLVEALWAGEPPATARQGFPVLVHRLRNALGPARIVHRSGGYELVAQADEVDARRFERLWSDGRRALNTGDPQAASALLSEALALWRGEAFAGLLDIEVCRLEAERLHELRTVALESRCEAELALGRHAELVPELTALVAEYPFRESLRALLMTALYRSERASDALEVYREARTRMLDELGLEPGVELRRLERAVLQRDPALAAPTAGSLDVARSEPRATPAELPPGTSVFTGRHEEFDRLVERSTRGGDGSGPLIAALNGPGGIGKSTLAVQVARAVADAYPDGQLYVNLHGTVLGGRALPASLVLGRLLRALGWTDREVPKDVDEAAAVFRSLTADRRLLFVFDDAADVAQVRPLLPRGPGSAVLVTSREALSALDGAEHVRVGELSEDEAVVLLARLAGDERVAAEPNAAVEIARLCGRLPLAVRIAGARLAARPDWSMIHFADRLRDVRGRLDELEFGDLAVRANYAASVENLPESAGRLLSLIGLPEVHDFAVADLVAMDGREDAAVQRDIDRLVLAHLVEPSERGRIVVHDLVRLYARDSAMADLAANERVEVIRRLVLGYVATAKSAIGVFPSLGLDRNALVGPNGPRTPGTVLSTPEEVAAWIRATAHNLEAIARHAADLPEGPAVLFSLAIGLFRPLESQEYWRELEQVDSIALTHVGPHRGHRSYVQRDLALALVSLGRAEEAREHLEQALTEGDAAGIGDDRSSFLLDLGRVHQALGNSRAAIARYRECLELARRQGDRGREATTLHNMALVELDAGRPSEGGALLERALQIEDELGQSKDRGITRGNLGEYHAEHGQMETAVRYLELAVEDFHAMGYSQMEAERLWDLGEVLFRLGHHDHARERWREAVAIGRAMNKLTAEEAERLLGDPTPAKPDAFD